MLGGTGDIRIIGGFVIWIFKVFKGSLKECIDNYSLVFIVGIITILVIVFLGINFYGDFKSLFSSK